MSSSLVVSASVPALSVINKLASDHAARISDGRRTSLEQLDLVHSLLLLFAALLELGNLDLLSELLEVPELPCFLRPLFPLGLLQELALDLAHVLVVLHHLRKVVDRSLEGDLLLLQDSASLLGRLQRLLVECELAGEVVVNVGDLDRLGGGERLVLAEGEFGDGDGNSVAQAGQRGVVVDHELLVGNGVLAVDVALGLEVRESKVLLLLILLLVFLLLLLALLNLGWGLLGCVTSVDLGGPHFLDLDLVAGDGGVDKFGGIVAVLIFPVLGAFGFALPLVLGLARGSEFLGLDGVGSLLANEGGFLGVALAGGRDRKEVNSRVPVCSWNPWWRKCGGYFGDIGRR